MNEHVHLTLNPNQHVDDYCFDTVFFSNLQAREYLEIANHYFSWSVTALGAKDYRQSLTLLKDCHFPLKEAQRFGRDGAHLRQCALLEEDIFTQQCVAESMQERVKGESSSFYSFALRLNLLW